MTTLWKRQQFLIFEASAASKVHAMGLAVSQGSTSPGARCQHASLRCRGLSRMIASASYAYVSHPVICKRMPQADRRLRASLPHVTESSKLGTRLYWRPSHSGSLLEIRSPSAKFRVMEGCTITPTRYGHGSPDDFWRS